MWLLDHNLPKQVFITLQALQINCDTTKNRNWQNLKNGELVTKAHNAGFTCILTKDVLFSESAAKAIKKFPDIAIILITIPQARGTEYANEFRNSWNHNKIKPIAGKLIRWPK